MDANRLDLPSRPGRAAELAHVGQAGRGWLDRAIEWLWSIPAILLWLVIALSAILAGGLIWLLVGDLRPTDGPAEATDGPWA